jgi:group I intron endonuclease
MAIIYMATNQHDGTVYIGATTQTLAQRKIGHKSDAKIGKTNLKFFDAIREYGWDAFDWEILDEVSDELQYAEERYWIQHFRSMDVPMYNETDGGKGIPGYKYSKEQMERRSILRIGKTSSFRGKKHTEEAKAKISASNMGNTYTAKTYNVILIAPNGDEHGPIHNLSAFCREHGLDQGSISLVIAGKAKHHHGWRLKQLN